MWVAKNTGVMSTEVPIQLYWRTGRKAADYIFRQFRNFGVGTETSDRPNKVGFTQAVGLSGMA